MYGKRFILFFLPPELIIGKSTNTEYYWLSTFALNTAFLRYIEWCYYF